jgi:hypothetical protein
MPTGTVTAPVFYDAEERIASVFNEGTAPFSCGSHRKRSDLWNLRLRQDAFTFAVGALIVFATPVIIIFGLRELWSAFVVRSETEVVTPMPRPTSP